jgi:hypothetical protein
MKKKVNYLKQIRESYEKEVLRYERREKDEIRTIDLSFKQRERVVCNAHACLFYRQVKSSLVLSIFVESIYSEG